MLLYTRLAQPKVPKKRSRAGCNYCKEKKKKCDEGRPQCARCQEQEQDCVYEAVKPRQRRKREQLSVDTTCRFAQPTSAPYDWHQQHNRPWTDDVRTAEIFASYGGHQTQHEPPSATTANSDLDSAFPPTADSTAFSHLTPLTTTASDLQSLDGQSVFSFGQNDEDDTEEIVRQDYPSTAVWSPGSHSSAVVPHDQYGTANQMPSPYFEFCAPAFAEFTDRKNRRHLVDHFCNVLSHLIVFREENGNPFQQLVLPLSNSSPAVMDTVYALSSAHLEFRGVQNIEKSDVFHAKAIQGLARLIEQGGGENRNELLGAIMLLVYYEVLVQKGRSNIVDGHLKGAMTIMSDREPSTDPTGVFLERAFKFYDVIAALSFGTSPLSAAPGRGFMSPLAPLDPSGTASPIGSVDTLLGMATTLWPTIHRLSNLVGVKDELDKAMAQGYIAKATVLRTELETTASAIHVALTQWQPILPAPSDIMTPAAEARLQSILNNALAYRHSAFVYLYRTIYGHTRTHTLVQKHTHLSLTHCVGTANGEGPMSALLWPLFVAACEAVTPDDRKQAEQTFAAIDRVQGMANIERAWCIVQEVWRRADEDEKKEGEVESGVEERFVKEAARGKVKGGTDLWRRVSREMGVNIVFG